MPWTIESALENELIQNQRKLLSEYKFELGEIPVEITIRMYQQLKGNKVEFTQSHFIHTPKQAGPYKTSIPIKDYEAEALHQVVSAFSNYYSQAVSAGCKPSPSWLIKNEEF